MKSRRFKWIAGAAAVAVVTLALPASAQTTYNIASIADFTGPYADIMKDLPKLSGEIVTEDGPEPVSGAEYWLSGPQGAASQFSGDAGRKRLSVHIRALIPRPAEGLNF